MENNNKHTPLPWTYKRTHHLSSDTWYVLIDPTGSGPIMDVGGKDVAGQIAEAKYLITDPDEIEANAKLIVTAVNNYASLTRELSELREERDRLRLTLSGKTFFDEREVMQKEITELREENERLKEENKKLVEIEDCNRRTWLNERQAFAEEKENLMSVMVAAAEEIQEHWQAHCDEDGYGPANLMRRLEKGIAANYPGYKPGAFNELREENERLMTVLLTIAMEGAKIQ